MADTAGSPYAAVIRFRVRAQTSYRFSFTLDVLGAVVLGLVDLAEIYVIFHQVDALGGFSFGEVALMYGLAGSAFSVADLAVGHIDRLPTYVRSGQLDSMLLRPLSALGQLLSSTSRCAGWAARAPQPSLSRWPCSWSTWTGRRAGSPCSSSLPSPGQSSSPACSSPPRRSRSGWSRAPSSPRRSPTAATTWPRGRRASSRRRCGGCSRSSSRPRSSIHRLPAAQWRPRLAECVELLHMSEFLDTPVRQLSLGQRMRGEVTAALLHSPELLVLDEPTIGLDLISKEQLRSFLVRGCRSATWR